MVTDLTRPTLPPHLGKIWCSPGTGVLVYVFFMLGIYSICFESNVEVEVDFKIR